MASTSRSANTGTKIKPFLAVAGLLLVAGFAWWFLFSGAPQIGTSEDVFKTVDALFTAVSAQDPALVDQCAKQLDEQHAAGELPDASWTLLSKVITLAHDGHWKNAAEKLYGFMLSQHQTAGASPKETAGELHRVSRN